MSELDFGIIENEQSRKTSALSRQAGSSYYKNDFVKGAARGADNLQATGYAFAQTISQLAGDEVGEAWAQRGITEQLRQAALNPARIQSYKDIEDFGDFGSYVLDTLGEQVPNAAMMATGAGGAAAAARAGIGKAVAKNLSKEALQQARKKLAVKGAKAGGLAATFPLTAGETQLEFNEEGIRNPLKALGFGAVNAAVEMGPLGKLIDKITDGTGQAKNLKDIISETSKTAGIQGVWGGLSEGAQTAINKFAVSTELDDYDIFSDDNVDEILESMAKGFVGQGAFAGGAQAISSGLNANFSKQKEPEEQPQLLEPDESGQMDMFGGGGQQPQAPQQQDLFDQDMPDPRQSELDFSITEQAMQGEFIPSEQIQPEQPQPRQAQTFDQAPEPSTQSERDFSSNAFLEGRQPAYIQTAGEPAPNFPEGVQSVEITPELSDDQQLQGATMFFNDPQAIDLLRQGSGVVQGYGVGSKPEQPTGAIVPIDSNGNEGSPILIDDTTAEPVAQAQQQRAGKGGKFKVISMEELADRIETRKQQNIVPVQETGEAQGDLFGFDGVEVPNANIDPGVEAGVNFKALNEAERARKQPIAEDESPQLDFSITQMKQRVDLTPQAREADIETPTDLTGTMSAEEFDAQLDKKIPERTAELDNTNEAEGEGGQGFTTGDQMLDVETVEFQGEQIPIDTTYVEDIDENGKPELKEVKGIRETALTTATRNLVNKDGQEFKVDLRVKGGLPREGFLKLAGPEGPVSVYFPQLVAGVQGKSPGTLDIARGTSGSMMTNLEQTLAAVQEGFAIIADTYGLGPKLKEQIQKQTLPVAVYRTQEGKMYTLKQLTTLVDKARAARNNGKENRYINKDHETLARSLAAGKKMTGKDYARLTDYDLKLAESSTSIGSVGTKEVKSTKADGTERVTPANKIKPALRATDAEKYQPDGTGAATRRFYARQEENELTNLIDKTVNKGKEFFSRISKNTAAKRLKPRINALRNKKKKTVDEHVELAILNARERSAAMKNRAFIPVKRVEELYKIHARKVINEFYENAKNKTNYLGKIANNEGFGLENVDANNADADVGNKVTQASLADSNTKEVESVPKGANRGSSYGSVNNNDTAGKTAEELWGIKGVQEKGVYASKNIDPKEKEFLQKMQAITGDETPVVVVDERDLERMIKMVKDGKLNMPVAPLEQMLMAMRGEQLRINAQGKSYRVANQDVTEGRYIPMGNFAVIGLRNSQKTMGERLMVLAHEYGHLLFKKQFDKMSQTERDTLKAEHAKSDEPNFEEWFADQVAAYFRENFGAKKATKDRGLLGKISEQLYRGYKKIFDAVKSILPDRFTSNAEFRKFMNKAIKNGAFKSKDYLGFGEYRDFGRDDFTRAKEKLKNGYNSQFVRNLSKVVNKLVRTGSARLRKMGNAGAELDKVFHSLSNTDDSTPGQITQTVKQNYEEAKLQSYKVGKKLFDVERNRVIEIKQDQRTGKKYIAPVKRSTLSKKVEGLKGWIEEHNVQAAYWMNRFKDIMPENNADWNDWLKTNAMGKEPSAEFKDMMDEFWNYANSRMGGKLGRVKNYFPRVYDPNLIMSDINGFKDILITHLKKRGDDTKTAIKKADGITNAILAEAGTDPNTMLMDENLRATGFDHKASRILNDIPDAELEAFMAEPSYRLLNYVQSAVKRAEYEMRAGNFDSIERLEAQLKHQVAMGQGDVEFYQSVAAKAQEYRDAIKAIKTKIDELKAKQKFEKDPAKNTQLGKDIVTAKKASKDLQDNPPEYWNPNGHVESLLEQIPEADRQDARTIIEGYMGRLGIETNATVSNLRQWIMALQYYTTLAFAALSSVTDMANILFRAKAENLSEFASYTKIMAQSFTDRKRQLEFGRALGVIQHDTVMAIINQSYGGTFQNPTVQKYNDLFFKYNGLEWLTTTTRIMSMNAGKHFLKQSALESSRHGDRYLKDLGLTKQDVDYWISQGEPMGAHSNEGVVDPRHELNKVASALNRFVDESILRPNSAQRPTWANSQNFFAQVIWQLKSFFWAFGHTIIEGVYRDIKARKAAGDSVPMAMMPLLIGGVPLLALAALGLEAKEFIKHGIEGGASDDMGAAAYAFDLFDRSGGLGPFGLATGMLQTQKYGGSAVVSLLGPTAEHVDTIFRSPVDGIERSIPYLSQTNGKFLGYNLSPF